MTRPERLMRVRRLLARGGWIEAVAGGYAVRAGRDRRARILTVIDEALFRTLVADPGLRVRPAGGWSVRGGPADRPGPAPGRPGTIDGTRTVMESDGRAVTRPANLAQHSVAWLARRKGPDGTPWLGPAEAAAAERLALEAEAALGAPSLTMRWDALPRTSAGGGGRGGYGPRDAALHAGARLEAALAACGAARGLVEQVCIRASALQAAEQALGLRRRTGKALLRQGLAALARHYRLA